MKIKLNGVGGGGVQGVRGVVKEWRIFIKKNSSDRMRKEVKCTEKKRRFE